MIVYIEYVLIDNFVIDYMLLSATLKTLTLPISKLRLCVCSAVGAIISIAVTFLPFNNLISGIIKLLFGLALASFSTKTITAKKLYAVYLVFLTYTFLLGGAVIAIFTLLNIDYSSEISIALMIIPCYIIVKCVKEVINYIYRRKDVVNFTFPVEINICEIRLSATAFLDTGNCAYAENLPVIFCDKQTSSKLISNLSVAKKIKKTTFITVNGEKELPYLVLEEIKVLFNGEENTIKNVALALTNKSFGVNYQVLFHPALMEVKSVKTVTKTKKVS